MRIHQNPLPLCHQSKSNVNISRVIRDYASYKNLYEKILSGEYVSQHQSREDAVAEATKQLEKNEESFPRSLNHIYQTAVRRTYYSLCGYTHEDEMVHTPGVRYDRQPEYIRNKEIQASGVLSIHFYCESREKFYAKRDPRGTAHNRTGYCETEITGREETHSYQR